MTSDQTGRVVEEWLCLNQYPNLKEAMQDKPVVSRTYDKDFYNWIWNNPAYEEYFQIID